MKIMLSACLYGENCKYNGGNNYHEELIALLKDHQLVLVCPEIEGGLGAPRNPVEIVNGIATNKVGQVVDREFRLGAQLCLDLARQEEVDLVILQPRSPSCGVKQIYDGSFTGRKIPGQGVFAKLMMDNGFRVIEPEDFIAEN